MTSIRYRGSGLGTMKKHIRKGEKETNLPSCFMIRKVSHKHGDKILTTGIMKIRKIRPEEETHIPSCFMTHKMIHKYEDYSV